ncbi:Uncharacterized protein SCF082_LOCUS50653, partial [Durusdinium trenchii]
DRDSLMHDWRIGKAVLEQEIERKTAFWDIIPHKLAGLLHTDHSKACAAAVACVDQFDKSAEQWHHRVSKVFLLPETPLRSAVEAMRSGANLFDLDPFIQVALLRFAGVSVVERSVESKHAPAKRYFSRASRFSGATVSLNLRLPEINRRMARDPNVFRALTRLLRFHECNSMRDLFSLVHLIGLSGHPAVQESVGQIKQKLAVLITYHMDVQSMLRLPDVYATVIRLDAQSRKKCLEEAKSAAKRLGHAALPAMNAEDSMKSFLLRGHCEALILHMAPNAKQLTASHQIVQLHLQLEHSERWKSNREILVAVDPVKPSVEKTGFHSFGLDLQRVDDDMLLSGWFCWDILPQHEFILLDTLDLPDLQGKDLCKFAPGDSTPQAMGLIRSMVNAQAFAKTENVFVIGSRGSSQWDDLQRAYLETLKAKGFVIAMDDQELSWQLTESGRRRIHACSVLTNKRSVGHARSPPGSKFDWTLHEMVSNLEGAGWNVVRERQKESARRALTLSQDLWAEGPADQKRIYFEKSLGKKYLLVLLHLKELFAVGVTEVFHGQPAGYYSRFFDNKGSPKKPAEQAEEGADSIMDIELEVVEADPPKIPPRRGKRARVAREDAGALPPLPPDPLTSIVLPPSSATQTRRRQAEIAPALADEDHEGDNDVIMESILAHFEFADENPDNPSQAPSSSAVVEATSHSAGGGGEVAEPVLELPEAEESNVE